MTTSPNLGLTLTPDSDDTKRFSVFRSELAGDSSSSNMMIIDTQVGTLIDKCEGYDTQPFTWGMLKNGLGNGASG